MSNYVKYNDPKFKNRKIFLIMIKLFQGSDCMKKFFLTLLICGVIVGSAFFVKKLYDEKKEKERIAEVKKGWYVEILTDYINVREKPDRYSYSNSKVNKGEVYEVITTDLNDPNLYWYQIKFKNGTKGWIANNTSGTYLKDHNNPVDIATPIIKFDENVYKVVSIKDINYNHLRVWDDKDDYKITHIVYHEVDETRGIDQYWIKYTITDGSGKYSSKTQKIEFENKPSEDEVTSFLYYDPD